MKAAQLIKLYLCIAVFSSLSAQTSCEALADYVKSEGYGSTYYSYSSSAVSQVTFYEITDSNYKTHYFAMVRFKSAYNDYLYQVGSNTKFNYSMAYMDSAGKAFWNYIEPYSDVLGCAPDLD
mgnify:CR=1 FL=1